MTDAIWLPLPFPECLKCGRAWDQCVHADCRGSIEVQPLTGRVRCLGCWKEWRIWESAFLCPCGARFEAHEIEDALEEMLDYCRQLVYEMSLASRARERREAMGKESMRAFMVGVMHGMGKLVGVAVESALRFFFPH